MYIYQNKNSFYVLIYHNNKRIYLGSFKKKEDAEQALEFATYLKKINSDDWFELYLKRYPRRRKAQLRPVYYTSTRGGDGRYILKVREGNTVHRYRFQSLDEVKKAYEQVIEIIEEDSNNWFENFLEVFHKKRYRDGISHKSGKYYLRLWGIYLGSFHTLVEVQKAKEIAKKLHDHDMEDTWLEEFRRLYPLKRKKAEEI